MTGNGVLQICIYLALLLLIVRPLGGYMKRVFNAEPTWADRMIRPIERLIYGICGIDPAVEQHWTMYTICMLLFSAAGMLLLYAMQRLQMLVPFRLNPQKFGAVAS